MKTFFHLEYRTTMILSVMIMGLLIGCAQESQTSEVFSPVKKNIDVLALDSIILKSDTLKHGIIKDFLVLPDSSLLFTDGKYIVKSNSMGQYEFVVNYQGKGRGEYIQAGKLFATSNYIYVWCEMTCHLLKYDYNMKFVSAYDGPHFGIGNFLIQNDTSAVFYMKGNPDNIIITLSLNEGQKLTEWKHSLSPEDRVLFLSSNACALGQFCDELYYSFPSSMCLHNLRTDDVLQISDKDFISIKLDDSKENSDDPREMLPYLYDNSLSSLITQCGGISYYVTETGSFVSSTNKRKINIFVFDEDKTVDAISFLLPNGVYMYKIYNNYMYLMSNNSNDEYVLTKLDIHNCINK